MIGRRLRAALSVGIVKALEVYTEAHAGKKARGADR